MNMNEINLQLIKIKTTQKNKQLKEHPKND